VARLPERYGKEEVAEIWTKSAQPLACADSAAPKFTRIRRARRPPDRFPRASPKQPVTKAAKKKREERLVTSVG